MQMQVPQFPPMSGSSGGAAAQASRGEEPVTQSMFHLAMQDYVSKMQASIMGHTTQLVQAMHTGLQSQIGQVDARVDAQQVEIDEIKKELAASR
eukprot:10828058-Karenia_brevis.AAC.1